MSDQRKVYVVTSGSYSDYGVVGIFSTREKALAVVRPPEGGSNYADFNEIEEWDVDLPREQLPGAYRVIVTETSRAIDTTWINVMSSDPPQCWGTGANRHFAGYGLTIEHARRSAEELRRQTLALKGKVVTPPDQPERET